MKPIAHSLLALTVCLAVETSGKSPVAGNFPALKEAWRPVDALGVVNAIRVKNEDHACNPLPPESRILAFEENEVFICAVAKTPAGTRRVFFLKPDTFVVDDRVEPSGVWQLRGRTDPVREGGKTRFAGAARALTCDRLWPASTPSPEAAGARFLHVLQTHPAGAESPPVGATLGTKNGSFRLTLSASNRVVRLELPEPGAGAGWVTMEKPDGGVTAARRPLASGVLPHGPEGMQMIERWDRAYRDGRVPSWDTGVVAGDLKKVVEDGTVRPCRAVILGCGSGANAVYLAGKGFDVTAIDLAPSALALGEEKARKAGVKVNWMLADVLAPPELEPFDFLFDRGCYHNVRYVDAGAFIDSVRRLSGPGAAFLVLSLNRDGPPGVREHHMREDFAKDFEFTWLNDSQIRTQAGGKDTRPSWALMLRRK